MNSSFTEDESIDSAAEDYDTDELKLQDIAAIVLGDVKQVCINEVTSDNENDSFEQRYKKCNANKPLNIDPYSNERDNLDAAENNQELANGNNEENEEPCSVDNLNESGDLNLSSRPPILEPSTNFVDQCSSPNTSPSRLVPYDDEDSLRSSSLSPIRREKTPEINESLSPFRLEKTPEHFQRDESLSPVRREKTPEEDESLSPVRRGRSSDEDESLSPVRRRAKSPEEDESLSPVRRAKSPEEDESSSPVRREKSPEEDESLSPVRREKSSEVDEPLSPARREKSPEIEESLSPARRENSPEVKESLSPVRREKSPEVDETLSPVRREKSPEVAEPLSPARREKNPEIEESLSPARLEKSPEKYESYLTRRVYSPEVDESLSPPGGEKTLENTEINDSSANSTDHSIDTECLLKVLDEVKGSPRSCESPSKQRIQNSTPPCVYKSIEQINPLDSDNYNSFCDKPNVEKLSGCDKPYTGDCTPRDGSQTPILYSPSSHDYSADLKDVTFDSTADVLKPEENETREKPNGNGAFESADELWKEDEDAISNSFTTIDIPLPPSENRSGENNSKRWNLSGWSNSKRGRDRSSSRRDRDRRDRSKSRRDRDRRDRSESRKDRDRRDRSESRKDRSRRDRSESRKDRSSRRDRSESRKDRSRRDRSESRKDRSSRRDRSESRKDRSRRDRSESRKDRSRRDRSESTKDRSRRDRSESRRDRDRRDRSESRRDRDKRDRRHSSRDGRSSKRSHHRDSSDEKHSKDSRSRKSDSDRSSKKRRSSGRRSSGHRSPDDHKRDDHRRSESSRWDRKERSRDRSSPHDDRRTSDRHSRDKSHHRDRYSSADKAEKSHSRRHDYSRSKRDYKKSRKHSYSSDASSDDSRAHKTTDYDRRSNDFDRKPNDFNRRTKNFDRRSKGFDRRSKDFGRRNYNSDRKSPDFDGVQKPPEPPEQPWNDDRFELNKEIEMPDPFEDENWDEDAEPGSYSRHKRPPEPKSPPPPEPDYPPPEPNYPPPPEPSYSPEDRPPSPAEEPMTTPPRFEPILENEYRTERSVSKDAERMICDCTLTKEEIHRGEKGCGEDCLNRLLLIECCSGCCLGERCSNKRFQRREYPNCEIFKTKKKGHGLRTLEDIPCGTFIMEYVGEVLDSFEFEQRAMEYARSKKPHFYFMSLKSDHIIDATVKGNISRFINHSCEPNTETQKWTVQGELRIGFFSLRDIKAGEEITFDYQLQRYGKQAQRCYCDAPTCNGWIGDDPDKYVNDKRGFKDWETALDEISQVGLMNRHQTLNLNRLMVHAKELPVRMQILQLIEEGNPPCRRLFVDYHGLPIIWSWMVDCTPEQDELRIQILKTLASLPITNKNILVDSKVLSVVEQWAFMFEQKVHSSEALSAQSVLESVEDIASANETPVSELAQKLMNEWSSLREAYRIPRKERIQQMKKHEQEADQIMPKHKPKRLPFYAEQMRDRYRRNRHSRDKDFEKIYFDRMKDYDGSTPDQKKRREGGRNFDRKHRRGDTSDESSNNSKVSKTEHRLMFEMKMKQKEEEQQQNWLKLFYSQQSQMAAAGMMLPAAFMAHLPPPNFPPPTPIDPKQQQPQQQQQPPASARTHPYYPIAPPVSYPTVPTPLMQLPPSTPTANSALPPSTQYYRTPIVAAPYPTPTAVPYPRPVIADQQQQPQAQPAPGHVKPEEQFVYDFQAIRNQMQQIAPIDEAMLRDTLRMAELAADRRESQGYPASSGGQPASDTDSAEQVKLPPNWKSAQDNEGRVYYYHTKTRVSQWYPPTEANRSDEDTSDGRSTGEDDEDVEFKKRRRKSSRGGEKDGSDMDAEIKENLAAMSSEFQDSDYEDYSPAFKNSEEAENADKQKSSPSQLANDIKPEKVPLTTEHNISPREPVEKAERVNNKKRMHELEEKRRRHKKARLTNGNSGSKGHSNGHVNTNSSKLVSAPADTSSITERKKKDAFRTSMANFVVSCLNPYFRTTCPQARITNDKDFKHLARKLTHFVMVKELKHCQSVTDLTCNSSVKYKAKEYIRKYMSKFGEIYVRPPDDANY